MGASGDFARPDPYPYMWWLRTVETVSVIAVLGLGWFTVLRPWLRTRRIPFDGELLLRLMLAYQVDPILDCTRGPGAEDVPACERTVPGRRATWEAGHQAVGQRESSADSTN